jgi:hypothetical protein
MKARQLELRGIPQFDSGRWKLRLERVPIDPDNETRMGTDFDSAARASVNETNEAYWFNVSRVISRLMKRRSSNA